MESEIRSQYGLATSMVLSMRYTFNSRDFLVTAASILLRDYFTVYAVVSLSISDPFHYYTRKASTKQV